MITYEDPTNPNYITIESAAQAVNRKPRTIYDWIQLENIRTLKLPNQPILVHIQDIQRTEATRAQGRRRKPKPPWKQLTTH